jgi:predicted nucleic acid-binding protein
MFEKSRLINYGYSQIVLDTSPFVILLVGLYNKESFKKEEYSIFDNLELFLRGRKIIITPQVLAETTNIIENKYGRHVLKGVIDRFTRFLSAGVAELYVPKNSLLKNRKISEFGFSDISVFLAARGKSLITGEKKLYYYCIGQDQEALHLDHFT